MGQVKTMIKSKPFTPKDIEGLTYWLTPGNNGIRCRHGDIRYWINSAQSQPKQFLKRFWCRLKAAWPYTHVPNKSQIV